MTDTEFNRVWQFLKTRYPYDCKDETRQAWLVALKDLNIQHVANALATHWENGKNTKAPTPKEIRYSVIEYKGKPDLLFRAIRTRIKTGSGYVGNYKPEFRD